MELNQYQYEAMKTRLKTANPLYSMYGLVGEVGEVFSILAKAIRDDDGITDLNSIKKELGDVLWFIAAIAADCGFTLDDVAETNLLKLQKRQKRGTLTGSGDSR